MRDIYRTRTLADAYLLRDVLRDEGIAADIRNEHMVGAEGSVPVFDGLPTVWVPDDDVERARVLLAERLGDDGPSRVLDEMGAGHDGPEAQSVLQELYVAATRLSRKPSGEAVDAVHRHRETLAATAAPFGVEAEHWERIRGFTAAVVDRAADDDADGVRDAAAALSESLGSVV